MLTNGTLLSDKTLQHLTQMEAASIYSLEIRVSLDGYSSETNDPIRGEGTFERAMEGVERLVAHGHLPILTITRTWDGDDGDVLAEFVKLLHGVGYHRPRLMFPCITTTST